MNTTYQPAVPSFITPLLITTERDIGKLYLGDDLEEICQFATSTGDPVLIASAALPLKNRREAVLHWRKKQVRNLLGDADFGRYIKDAPEETMESILDGKTSFVALADAVLDWKQQAGKLRMERLNATKAALRAALRGALTDCDGSEEGTMLPGFVAVLATGEVGLFRRRVACLEWARASRQRFYFGVMDGASGSIHPAPEGED